MTQDCLDLPIRWLTDTGIQITIETIWDWIVFGDVWINREYPIYIPKKQDKVATILDLGANVGYFSLLAAHECRKVGQEFRIYAVEGNYHTFNTLLDRTDCIRENFFPYYGLVGCKANEVGYISQSSNHGTSAIIRENSDLPKELNYYLDFNLPYLYTIDLLKCDIEGSEHDFVRNYGDLLRRTQTVFMEIHYLDEAPELYAHMKEYGFKESVVVMNHGACRTEVFSRA